MALRRRMDLLGLTRLVAATRMPEGIGFDDMDTPSDVDSPTQSPVTVDVVYYCVDDHASLTGYNPEQMLRGEKDLCRRSDLVVTTSMTLQDAKPTFPMSKARPGARDLLANWVGFAANLAGPGDPQS